MPKKRIICEQVKELREAATKIKSLESEKAALSKKVRDLTALLDAQLGTPCEQISHQQEVEELKAREKEALEDITDVLRRLLEDIGQEIENCE